MLFTYGYMECVMNKKKKRKVIPNITIQIYNKYKYHLCFKNHSDEEKKIKTLNYFYA